MIEASSSIEIVNLLVGKIGRTRRIRATTTGVLSVLFLTTTLVPQEYFIFEELKTKYLII